MNEDIIGGLKSALTRGYSLEEAMFSFFNAGYKKQDIEDAARALQIQEEHKDLQNWEPEPIWATKQKLQEKAVSIQSSRGALEKQKQETSGVMVEAKPRIIGPAEVKKQVVPPGRVSEYAVVDPRTKIIITILVVLLLLLLGILGIIFIFKQQIIQFFNSIF